MNDKLPEISNFFNRISLRSPKSVIVDDAAQYIQIFEEVTEEQNDDLAASVMNGYSFPNFSKRGTVTYKDGEMEFHVGRETSRVPQETATQLIAEYKLDELNPRLVNVPVDQHNTFSANIPDRTYCFTTDFSGFDEELSGLYQETDDISLNYDWHKWVEE